MILLPFAAMLAAACVLVFLSGMLRQFAGQPAAKPMKPRGRHARPAAGATYVVTFGQDEHGHGRLFRYHVVGDGAR